MELPLSIIIVTWNGDSQLANCLDSLSRVYSSSCEVIVVDNAANDSTEKLVAGFAGVKYVASKTNLGFAGGNNLGLKQVTRDYVLLLNDDTIIHADSFSPMIEFLRSHEHVGIVQGTMNVPALNNGLDDCGTELTLIGLQKHLHRGEPTATTVLKPRKVFAAKGAMLMFKRKILDDLGGILFFDHFKSYYEETDFCHRARNAGWETWFVPTPPIDHLGGMTTRKFSGDDIWAQYIRNILWSFHHNFGIFGHLVTLPLFTLGAFIKMPRETLKALNAWLR